MKKILLLLTLAALPFVAFAQHVVKGMVTEAPSGEPLIGATVQIKGTTKGGTTDINGKYSLEVRDGETLVFSYVGMRTQEAVVTSKTKTLDIRMEKDALGLEEIIVVGYGTTRKRDLSGAIASVKAEDVKAGVVTNAAQMLKGRASGVQVRQNTSEPGGGITVRVRGASSISSNNDPLYVIDGFQTDMGNQINPGDIESMEVLKDAAATAIYGARGANGVIIITTKHGVKNNFKVDYSYNASVKNMYNPLDLMDAQDVINYRMKNWEDNGGGGNPPYTEEQRQYTGAGTDWLALATRTALTQTHQFSISGGKDRLLMAVSGNYTDDKGILSNTNFNRFSGRMNMSYELTNNIRFGANTYFSRSSKDYINMGTNAANDNVMYALFMASPINTPGDTNVFGERVRKESVLSELNDVDFNNVVNTAYASVHGEVDLFKFLTARVQYTYSNNNSKSQKYYPKTTNIGTANEGLATTEIYKTDNQQLDALLTYHQTVAKKLNMKVLLGTTYTTYKEEGNGIRATGFSTDEFSYNNLGAAKTVESISSYKVMKNNLSYFLRGEFVWNDKYILNASIRADGASNFGPDNKWGYFPAVSAAWQLGDEKFMQFAKPLFSTIKLRASYGITGNDGIGTYQSISKYGTQQVFLGGDSNVIGMYETTPANPNLKWESTSQFNVGADVTLLNQRIEVGFDYYVKTTSDLLNSISVSSANGGFTTMMGNNGKIQNKGFELFIKSNNFATKDFSWVTTLNLSRNRNKVLELNEGEARYQYVRPMGWYESQEYIILQEGLPMSSLYGYVFDGLIQTGETYSAQPKSVAGEPKFKDLDGDGLITNKDRTVIGDGNPDIIIGFGNNLRYRDFDLSFFFDSALGGDMLNLTRMLLEDQGRLKSSMDRWTQVNPSNRVPRYGYQKDAGLKYGSYINSDFIENASFLRLSNIELGYSLPCSRLGAFGKYVKGLRVFVGGQNLFTVTKYTGFDPEVSTNGGTAYAQGLDYNSYPAYRTFNFGAKITF